MVDRFEGREPNLTGPAVHGFVITPSDGAALAETTRALYVGGAGDLAVLFASGGQAVLSNVPAGTLLPLRAIKVLATGTSASAIVGLA